MEPKSHNNIIVITLIAVIITAAVTGGIVYTIQSKQNTTSKNDLQAQVDSLKSQIAAFPTASPKPIASAAPTATPVSSASPVATADPTAGWKTYTFTEANISFSYPSEWGTVTVKQGRTTQGTSPYIIFSANTSISGGTYSKDLSANRGALDHEAAVKTILTANNNCQSIILNAADKLACTVVSTKSNTSAYFVGNIGTHALGPGPQEALMGYAQYPSISNFTDFVFISTNTTQSSVDYIKELLSTIKFL